MIIAPNADLQGQDQTSGVREEALVECIDGVDGQERLVVRRSVNLEQPAKLSGRAPEMGLPDRFIFKKFCTVRDAPTSREFLRQVCSVRQAQLGKVHVQGSGLVNGFGYS